MIIALTEAQSCGKISYNKAVWLHCASGREGGWLRRWDRNHLANGGCKQSFMWDQSRAQFPVSVAHLVSVQQNDCAVFVWLFGWVWSCSGLLLVFPVTFEVDWKSLMYICIPGDLHTFIDRLTHKIESMLICTYKMRRKSKGNEREHEIRSSEVHLVVCYAADSCDPKLRDTKD